MSKRAKRTGTGKQVNGLSRREFIKNAGIIAGGAAVVGAVGCAPAEAPKPWIPAKWDYEADVVVVGYGGAGASAAIGAYDKGAKVILIEKAPEKFAGGNTSVSGGGFSIPPSYDVGMEHYKMINMGTVTDDEVTSAFVDGLLGIDNKLKSIGVTFPPTAPGIDKYKLIADAVKQRGIQVMYETPATGLIQDAGSKEILGVVAKSKSDQILNIKAKRGVVLSLGGYENNVEMQTNYNIPGIRAYPWGSPYNTGDGIKMVQHVGAQLWHLSCIEWAPFCFRTPSELYQCSFSMPFTPAGPPYDKAGYMFVNSKGERFMNEALMMLHAKEQLAVNDIQGDLFKVITFPTKGVGFKNDPFYMVYDKKLQDQGKIWREGKEGYRFWTWAAVHQLYEWSADNSAEISKGWIIKADTIAELASKAKIDAAGLQAAIDKYNAYCRAQKDSDFGRIASNLVPIDAPPYYITELALSWVNTQGGPKHNAKNQIVDENYKPIGRLYAAGEFGSFFGGVYHGANNFPEAFASGFVSGENAAALTSWDKVS